MKNKGTLYAGLLLITLGLVFMVIQMTRGIALLGWRGLWPLLVLFVGFAFWLPFALWWRQRVKFAGLIVPATIITANGLLLLVQAVTHSWISWRWAWALEPVAVGASLLLLYALGPRTPGLLTAAGIVGGVGLVLLVIFGTVFSTALRFLLPVAMILVGLIMFLRASRQRAVEDGPRA